MRDTDITLFAELIHSQFGPTAGAEAGKRADYFERQGDAKNAAAWRTIRTRLHQFDRPHQAGTSRPLLVHSRSAAR